MTAVDSCKTAVENPYIAITKLFFKLETWNFHSSKYGQYVSEIIFGDLLNSCQQYKNS